MERRNIKCAYPLKIALSLYSSSTFRFGLGYLSNVIPRDDTGYTILRFAYNFSLVDYFTMFTFDLQVLAVERYKGSFYRLLHVSCFRIVEIIPYERKNKSMEWHRHQYIIYFYKNEYINSQTQKYFTIFYYECCSPLFP